jgi:hypothetical protein
MQDIGDFLVRSGLGALCFAIPCGVGGLLLLILGNYVRGT